MLTHDEILEVGKIMSDFFKQLITLNTGMVVLIITIVEKVFTPEKVYKNRLNIVLVSASILCFIGSLWISLVALVSVPSSITAMLQGGATSTWTDNFSFYASLYSFLGGVILFVALAIVSFSSQFFAKNKKQYQPRLLRKNLKRKVL